jgi:hypothetical protein
MNMKLLATAVGVLVVLAGVVGIITPDEITVVGRHIVTQNGLYIIAVLRICIGLVFILAAPASRMPRTLRVIGAIVFIAGIATPLFGVDRSRAILDWWISRGSSVSRLAGVVAIAAGAFIIHAVGLTGGRTSDSRQDR